MSIPLNNKFMMGLGSLSYRFFGNRRGRDLVRRHVIPKQCSRGVEDSLDAFAGAFLAGSPTRSELVGLVRHSGSDASWARIYRKSQGMPSPCAFGHLDPTRDCGLH